MCKKMIISLFLIDNLIFVNYNIFLFIELILHTVYLIVTKAAWKCAAVWNQIYKKRECCACS